jgi:hypothetical protein
MALTVATVAARLAAKTWGGRWLAAEPQETREPGSFPGSKGSRAEGEHAQATR